MSSSNASAAGATTAVKISPHISSGLKRQKWIIVGGLLFLTIVYLGLYWLLKDSVNILKPADRFCFDHDGDTKYCTRSDLFAFQFCSMLMMIFMGGLGFYSWHISKTAFKYKTPEGKLFGYIKEADTLLAGVFVYQFWDFIISFFIKEMSSPIFLAHHLLSGLTALFSIEYQMVHHYAIFFGGCSEISSWFLVVCDFNEYFPAEWMQSQMWTAFVFFCQASFTLTFLYYRIIAWWIVSIPLWKDVLYVCGRKKKISPTSTSKNQSTTKSSSSSSSTCIAQDYRPNTYTFLYFFLSMDTILGLLQVYWFVFGMIPKILEILQNDE